MFCKGSKGDFIGHAHTRAHTHTHAPNYFEIGIPHRKNCASGTNMNHGKIDIDPRVSD